ncbi:hypothetical protein JEQ12_005049 [Ovis aries]|uniref:THIF-type NAD/FAD binding fold domain-containing protein n=1 Tax=Ovis aries TaxID=9940 RepID=A0A836CWU3_SHEEP|nr:hypothetical protein JEQ12_005049 [Ovis aries]
MAQPGKLLKEQKYDRQLRLWGDHGQEALESAHVCLINATATGTEILKNLVLPGIGSFTIIDGNQVSGEDAGNNFFLQRSSIGKNRAQAAMEFLQELNNDVSGSFVEESPENLLDNDPSFFCRFTIVVATQLSESTLLRLADVLWNSQIPLLICRTYGLVGYMRIIIKEHPVIESHPDNALEDLRLDKPFPELREHFQSYDLDHMEKKDHSHTPWIVIVAKYLAQWYSETNGRIPKTYKEKEDFRDLIRQGILKNENGAPEDEENFEEAIKNVNTALNTTQIPSSIEDIFNDDRCINITKQTPTFWILARALKEFVAKEGQGNLPVRGTIPDMIADSGKYIKLQNVYREKAKKDAAAVGNHVAKLLQSIGQAPESISEKELKLLCSNSAFLRVVRCRSLAEEYSLDTVNKDEIISSMDNPDNEIVLYLMLRAVDRFHKQHGRYPGVSNYQVEEDIGKLKSCLTSFLQEYGLSVMVKDDYVHEFCRYGAAEPHTIAAFLGEVKTDLNLLLECLKYQMDNAFSQKEALVTIHSICQQNSNAGLYFREIGGLMFVKNLAKSSEHSMVKEAALYTLGAVAEQNVYCQQTLCTSELFEDLIWFLSNSDSNTNLKRMSVYVILVLVSNNRTGQTLVRETGCISVLSQLFKTVLSKYELNLSDESASQSYQLWSSVCSTLCVCVNNPQNDENQMVCSSLFTHANDWLINCMKAEIIRPICSFIGLTLANNTYVQKYFISVGGLDVLSQVLVQLESDSHKTPFSAKLAVVVTKTVDACIADNPTFGVVLSKYHIVSKLLALLLLDSLDSGEKFSVILTLGHCTEDCEENQYDFFKNNGLPLMIQALTESQSEELNKAATFVLHNCKKISEKLSLSLGEYSFDKNEEHLKDINMKEKNLEDYWKKAKEILHRIEELETKGNEENIQGENYKNNISSVNVNIQDTLKHFHADSGGGVPKAEDKDKSQARKLHASKSHKVMSKACTNDDQVKMELRSANPVNACYRESGQNKTLCTANSSCKQNLCEETTSEKKNFVSQSRDHIFKHPTPIAKNTKQQLPVTDPFTLCSDIINKEVISFLETDSCSKMLRYRCSGCIAVGKSLNSRNFSKLLHCCPYQCDRHKAIVEAEDRYKSELRKSLICNKIMEPFGKTVAVRQQGRKAVDLAHKYHKLTKCPKYVAP